MQKSRRLCEHRAPRGLLLRTGLESEGHVRQSGRLLRWEVEMKISDALLVMFRAADGVMNGRGPERYAEVEESPGSSCWIPHHPVNAMLDVTRLRLHY